MFNNLVNSMVAIITYAILFVMLSYTNAYTPTTVEIQFLVFSFAMTL